MARINAFYQSLHANQYNVKSCLYSRGRDDSTAHYCQFSGAGDLYITKDNSSSLVVGVVPIYENLVDDDLAAPEGSLAPSSSEVEGIEKIKFQLWACMIVHAISKFEESLKLFRKKDLLDLEHLSVYGMTCSEDGTFGVFKLEMDLIRGYSMFITKIPLRIRDRLPAAALMDLTLCHYDKDHF